MDNLIPNWIINLIQIGANIATVGAVFFVWRQSHQTQQQMDASLRPRVGGGKNGLIESESDELVFDYTNYGSLPTKLTRIRITHKFTEDRNQKLTKDDLKNLDYDPKSSIGLIFPNQIKNYYYKINQNEYNLTKQSQTFLYVGMIIDYEYANNKKAEYGAIYIYSTYLKKFITDYQWDK